MVVMIGETVRTGWCKHCRQPITLTRWQVGDERWTHDGTCDRTCAGAPVAEEAEHVITKLPCRSGCDLPTIAVPEGEVYLCPACGVPWQGQPRQWRSLDYIYVGPTRAVRDEPQS